MKLDRIGACMLALVAGCGGSDTGAPAKDLTPYLGTWQGPCNDRALPTLSFTATATPEVLGRVVSTEYFDRSGCSGALVATLSHTPATEARFLRPGDGRVPGPRPGETATITFDVFSIAAPARTGTMVGATVRGVSIDGIRQWCFDDSFGTRCVPDPGTQPATVSEVNHLLATHQLYLPTPSGSVYELNPPYVRR